MNQTDLHEKSGIARSTVNNLRTSTRPPLLRIVNALADAVGLDRVEAAQLAGLLPAEPDASGISVRAAIAASPVYTQAQKDALLAMVDVLDQANAQIGAQQTDARHSQAG